MNGQRSFTSRLRRGHLVSRSWDRLLRDLKATITVAVLSLTRPRADCATIVTLNADEENATVQAVFLADSGKFKRITLISPSPSISQTAVTMAARRLGRQPPSHLHFRELKFPTLLMEYRRSVETYSTHVLLPGRDFSKRRRHVHLTHGSGLKPDSTFRSPINVLASITPHLVPQQLKEYNLPKGTEVINYMPRLEIMRRSVGDRSILIRLGVNPSKPLIVWAPTYRKIQRGKQVQISGQPLSAAVSRILPALVNATQDLDGTLIIKPHPHDADDYTCFGLPILTNSQLREAGVTPYEVFGVASIVVTDYSSIYVEREAEGLDILILQTDRDDFAASHRGLRHL